jgi:hypothetical protein
MARLKIYHRARNKYKDLKRKVGGRYENFNQ